MGCVLHLFVDWKHHYRRGFVPPLCRALCCRFCLWTSVAAKEDSKPKVFPSDINHWCGMWVYFVVHNWINPNQCANDVAG
ncbi:hypothetical protein V6N11_044751 [Hibiscus sabdariffa]|uniref:Uncharacterized protein n=2 Tax=Hibiscus sabdariffa TaxID=183260 RepID=A0ABR2A241_9ROSI